MLATPQNVILYIHHFLGKVTLNEGQLLFSLEYLFIYETCI